MQILLLLITSYKTPAKHLKFVISEQVPKYLFKIKYL